MKILVSYDAPNYSFEPLGVQELPLVLVPRAALLQGLVVRVKGRVLSSL